MEGQALEWEQDLGSGAEEDLGRGAEAGQAAREVRLEVQCWPSWTRQGTW